MREFRIAVIVLSLGLSAIILYKTPARRSDPFFYSSNIMFLTIMVAAIRKGE